MKEKVDHLSKARMANFFLEITNLEYLQPLTLANFDTGVIHYPGLEDMSTKRISILQVLLQCLSIVIAELC